MLREQAGERWVEVADRVKVRALTSTRRSLSVRGQAAGGAVQVSEQVVIAYLHDALRGVAGTEVLDIELTTRPPDALAGVTLLVSVRYGTPVLPVADTLRLRAAARLRELLGEVALPVSVGSMHVHVDDVHLDQALTSAPARLRAGGSRPTSAA